MRKVKCPSFVTRCSMSAMVVALAVGTVTSPVLAQQSAAAPAEQAVKTGIPAWGIDNAELPPEEGVVYGVLDNGMRYALKAHATPKGEAAMRLMVDVGAGDERDDEEGAAHFVEHMAFNGSTNIPEGALIPALERLGLAFGADTNAETSLDYTMYKLDLPKLDPETVDTSLKILREIAGELIIAPEAVERERGIMISEYQVRNSPVRRRVEKFLSNSLPDPRLGERLTAEPAALQGLSAETLRGFYHGFYRPERTTLVIVGDFDVAEMERKLRANFGDWRPVGEARARYTMPALADSPTVFDSFVDPATPELVDLQTVSPMPQSANSVTELRDGLLEQIAAVALSNRINAIALADNTRTLGGQALVQELFGAAKAYGLILVASDGQWAKSLETGEQEWRRLNRFGFTEAEIAEAKANFASNLATSATQAASRAHSGIAESIAKDSLLDRVTIGPQTVFGLYQALEGSITPQNVSAIFNARWGAAPDYVMLASKSAVEVPAATMQAVLAQSAASEVTAPVEAAPVEFAYSDFGPAGQVVSDSRVADLDIRTLTFANGVQLNLKKTDFEPGKIAFRMDAGQGSSAFPAGLAGLGFVAGQLATLDGLAKHSPDEMRRVLAGRQVGIGYAVNPDAVTVSGATTPDDAQFQMQLLAAQISDTAFRDETQQQWQSAIPIFLSQIANSPDALFGQTFLAALSGGDDRLGSIDIAQIAQRSVSEMKMHIGGQFANGAIRLGVVGDFDEAAIIAAVANTLGALSRPQAAPTAIAPVRFTRTRDIQSFYHTGEADQGRIALSWPAAGDDDLGDVLTRRLLADLVQIRLRDVLREELGATYTPDTISLASSIYEGWGSLTLTAPADPATMDMVSQAIREVVDTIKTQPLDADALERARQPILENYQRQERQNDSWTGLVAAAQYDARELDRRRQRAATLAAITPEQVQQAARIYLQGEPLELRYVPQPAAAPSSE